MDTLFAGLVGLIGVFAGAYLAGVHEDRTTCKSRLEELGELTYGLTQWLRVNFDDLEKKGIVSTEYFNRMLVLGYYYSYSVHAPLTEFVRAARSVYTGEATLDDCVRLASSANRACLNEFKHRFSLPFWHYKRFLFWWDTRKSRFHMFSS